jgi:hypothetical protein
LTPINHTNILEFLSYAFPGSDATGDDDVGDVLRVVGGALGFEE